MELEAELTKVQDNQPKPKRKYVKKITQQMPTQQEPVVQAVRPKAKRNYVNKSKTTLVDGST